jgi:hypothetical protein
MQQIHSRAVGSSQERIIESRGKGVIVPKKERVISKLSTNQKEDKISVEDRPSALFFCAVTLRLWLYVEIAWKASRASS